MRLATPACRFAIAFLAGAVVAPLAPAQGRPSHDGKVAVFGTLHAHSTLSGDVSESKGLSPLATFEHARANGLDFLGISDHHKPTGAPGGSKFNLKASDYEEGLVALAQQLNSDLAGSFVAIPGIEWGTISTGNHINIFGASKLPPNDIEDTDYDELFEWIEENALFAQANHPYSWGAKSNRNRDVGNYGRELYPGAEEFVQDADGALSLMSVICTVRGGHVNGTHAHSTEKTHRDAHSKALREYRRHLDMGFHLSPSANQDTHGKNPGSVTAARTGVWVDEFTLDGIASGIRANRVFATEDDELAVALQVRFNGQTSWMGETVLIDDEEVDVTMIVFVRQALDSAGTGQTEGPYTATLFSDSDGVGGAKAAEWETFDIPGDTGLLKVELPVVAGEYFYIEVREQNGSDNLIGDGEDEFGVDGSEQPDGFRDDRNDSAWTSPVWFALAQAEGPFVWSVRSGIFHDPDCWAVGRIGAANRREGPKPDGKRKHECRQ